MSSLRRIEANRRNALKSTGPRTPEGKAKAAQNATTHGLARLTITPINPGCFLPNEDPAAFLDLLNEYVDTYRPQHRDEIDLLTEAVFAKWRQQRLWLAESAQLQMAIALHEPDLRKSLPNIDPAAQLANGLAKSDVTLRLHIRYEAQLHRQYLRCLKELRDLQDDRQAGRQPLEPQNGDSPIEPIPTPKPPQSQEPTPPETPNPATPIEPKATWCPKNRRWI